MRAVLFDFNGTLFDDTRFHRIAWLRYMKRRFNIELSDSELSKGFLGANNDTIYREYFGDRLTDEEIIRYSREKEEEYRNVVRSDPDNLRLIDGVPEMLDDLKENNIPFALATASIIENVNFYLNELGLKRWFTLDRIVYDEGILASKPDPAFYLEAARRLNLKPSDCVIFEDSRSGIQAAVNAGAGKIVAIDRSIDLEILRNNPNIDAIIHDYFGFKRFI